MVVLKLVVAPSIYVLVLLLGCLHVVNGSGLGITKRIFTWTVILIAFYILAQMFVSH